MLERILSLNKGINRTMLLIAAIVFSVLLFYPQSAFATGGHVADHPLSADMNTATIIQYIARALWYLAALALSGWVLGLSLFRPASELRAKLRGGTRTLLWAHLLTLLLVIVTHLEELLNGAGLDELGNVLFGTNTGIGWMLLLALTLAGFVLLAQSLWLDVAWSAFLFAAIAIAGHASVMQPQWAAVALDVAHIAAAAVWIGGIALARAVRRTQPDALQRYLRAFIPAALAALALLAATGVVSAWLYLPSMQYIVRTQWGVLLLIKIGATALAAFAAIGVAAALRRSSEAALGKRLKATAGWTLAIMLLVGLMTHMSPGPSNKPLYWHVMGETMHMTARIDPLYAGDNTFSAKIWVPQGEQSPQRVGMLLYNTDKPESAPIQVPLQPVDRPSETFFEDFTEHTYEAKGRYLPDPGNWKLEVRVIRANGEEAVYERDLKVN
jgi:copper transport protein